MLDNTLLRNNIDEIAENLAKKSYKLNVEVFKQLEEQRKIAQVYIEEMRALRNSMSKKIGILKSQGADISELMTQINSFDDQLKKGQTEFDQIDTKLLKFYENIPNILDKSVPVGSSELENKEIRKFGVIRDFDFNIKDHVELGELLNNQINFDVASKMSGSRFVVMKAQIAKLHRVLTQFMLDIHTKEHGYIEMSVPYLVSASAVYNVGQLPKFEEDLFKVMHNNAPMYLIPTAEVPLTNLVAGKILKSQDLPLKFTSHTPCFRSEAGSYGRDTKGMIRMHQFDKIEMVQIVHPDESLNVLEEMVKHAEKILQLLNLPYRVMLLCGGDTGFCSTKTYDLEVWLPSQNTYREISSISSMSDFQARRMQARFKNELGKNELVHTLNGSGLAVGRTLVAILENYQNADGSITIPEILRPYMGIDRIAG